MQLGGRRIPSDRQERRERALALLDRIGDSTVSQDERGRLLDAYRRLLEPAPEPPAAEPVVHSPGVCCYCYGPTNGEPVCSDQCDQGAWAICPTTDGELWQPSAEQ
jgi:hypothetical protein